MPRWFSEGWVIGVKNLTANTYIACVVAKDHGVWRGVVRGKRPNIGNYVYVTWHSKDITGLGNFTINTLELSYMVKIMSNINLLHNFFIACEAMMFWCNEREPIAYVLFSQFISGKSGIKELLCNILKEFWHVDALEHNIFSLAKKLELRKLRFVT